jgi:hypothetical protein
MSNCNKCGHPDGAHATAVLDIHPPFVRWACPGPQPGDYGRGLVDGAA